MSMLAAVSLAGCLSPAWMRSCDSLGNYSMQMNELKPNSMKSLQLLLFLYFLCILCFIWIPSHLSGITMVPQWWPKMQRTSKTSENWTPLLCQADGGKLKAPKLTYKVQQATLPNCTLSPYQVCSHESYSRVANVLLNPTLNYCTQPSHVDKSN